MEIQFICWIQKVDKHSFKRWESHSSLFGRYRTGLFVIKQATIKSVTTRNTYMLFAGREVRIGKTVLVRGLEYGPRGVLETEGTVFPNTDRPRIFMALISSILLTLPNNVTCQTLKIYANSILLVDLVFSSYVVINVYCFLLFLKM